MLQAALADLGWAMRPKVFAEFCRERCLRQRVGLGKAHHAELRGTSRGNKRRAGNGLRLAESVATAISCRCPHQAQKPRGHQGLFFGRVYVSLCTSSDIGGGLASAEGGVRGLTPCRVGTRTYARYACVCVAMHATDVGSWHVLSA